MAPPSDGDLRLRYLDWCSAKVAERFQELPVDEVWERAHRVLQGRASTSHGPSSPGDPSDQSGYLDLVRLLSLQLADELALPSFREWKEEYLRDPKLFEREMMGFGDRRTSEEPTH